jgi:undecaprenyl diphosphate synthase
MQKRVTVPKNFAIIPDGNRRWSKSHRMSLANGYKQGIEKFVDFSIWLKRLGASTVTVWALSTENIENRSSIELSILYKLYKKASYDKKLIDLLNKNETKVVVIGNMRRLPSDVVLALKHLQNVTKKNAKFTINLLIAYGGRDDILYAAKRLLNDSINKKIKVINERILQSYMMTAGIPEPDIIIRTSGELRTSGFLPWQSSYSELYFSKKYWPDFGIDDLKAAISDFSSRQRRYGK